MLFILQYEFLAQEIASLYVHYVTIIYTLYLLKLWKYWVQKIFQIYTRNSITIILYNLINLSFRILTWLHFHQYLQFLSSVYTVWICHLSSLYYCYALSYSVTEELFSVHDCSLFTTNIFSKYYWCCARWSQPCS